MRDYRPRRAGKRWLEGAPAYVLDVLDNKGKTADRYTVLFTFPLAFTAPPSGVISNKPGEYRDTFVPYLGMSGAPTHPQGFSQWGEMSAYQAAGYRYRAGKERTRWLDLPENIRAHVIARATDKGALHEVDAADLQPGDLVDLEGDAFADPRRNHPAFECELVEVASIERETADCVAVNFEGFDVVGFPPGHKLRADLSRRPAA